MPGVLKNFKRSDFVNFWAPAAAASLESGDAEPSGARRGARRRPMADPTPAVVPEGAGVPTDDLILPE